MDFFRPKPEKQYSIAYYGSNKIPFKFEYLPRKDTHTLDDLNNKWEVNTNFITIKTLSIIDFKKDDTFTIDAKKYRIETVYTEDEDLDINSPEFKSQRTYKVLYAQY
jgi:hypothetical protein